MQTVDMTAAVPAPDWTADTSPALQISSGGNHSNNAIIIPVVKHYSVLSANSKYESMLKREPRCQLCVVSIKVQRRPQSREYNRCQIDFRSNEE